MNKGNITIKKVTARQIFDSRGNPTVEATVLLSNGITGVCASPSGASTGMYEAYELRDNDGKNYNGKSVFNAVKNVNTVISPELCGISADDQGRIDKCMIDLDGSPDKHNLGANAVLAVSIAAARAAATSYQMPLYMYLGGMSASIMPVPMMNILNGGAHASNNLEIQEFMIFPLGAESFEHAMKMCVEIYYALKKELLADNMSTAVGDEGGFAPNLPSDEKALEYIVKSIEKAGYTAGKDVFINLDIAASEWCKNGEYFLPKSGKSIDRDDLLVYYKKLCSDYPIFSIEDPFSENDWESFSLITKELPGVQIVGDDLFVTNVSRLRKGIMSGAANAILIKPNQIGTLSETIDAVSEAKANNYRVIISHRSGETEDSSIADLAVAIGAGQIKAGAPVRSERVCKYNRLLRIEEWLGGSSKYGIPKL